MRYHPLRTSSRITHVVSSSKSGRQCAKDTDEAAYVLANLSPRERSSMVIVIVETPSESLLPNPPWCLTQAHHPTRKAHRIIRRVGEGLRDGDLFSSVILN